MNNKILAAAAALIAAAAVVVVVIQKNKTVSTNETVRVNTTEAPAVKTQAPAAETGTAELDVEFSADSGIEIAADALPENKAAVLNFSIDGTAMALLAVKDSDGEIHIAFDTCQVCNGSPRAYFEDKNGKLQCQNCGNTFSLSAVGSESYGCNPIKVDDEAISRTESGAAVSGDYLIANAGLFANWKK